MFISLNQSVQTWNFSSREKCKSEASNVDHAAMFSVGKKCVILGSKSNYDANKAAKCKLKERTDAGISDHIKIPLLGFPSETKFFEERTKWIKAIPFLDQNTINVYKTPPVLCARHWPNDFEKKRFERARASETSSEHLQPLTLESCATSSTSA